jgi:hypothetical protein
MAISKSKVTPSSQPPSPTSMEGEAEKIRKPLEVPFYAPSEKGI